MTLSQSNDAAPPLSRGQLLLIAVLAAVPRLWGLGSGSMWLDEILQTMQAKGSLGELWRALRVDGVHPPFDGLLTWLLLRAEPSEAGRRLVPVLFGVLTVVLLARWVSARFGRRAAWCFALLAALAPMHVHYSQELRPYSLALLAMAAALLATDWLLAAGAQVTMRQGWLLLGLCLLACAYSLYLAMLVWVPVVVLVAEDWLRASAEQRTRAKRILLRMPLLLVVLGLAYLPWMGVMLGLGSRQVELAASPWTWERALRRLEHLSLGGLEGDPARIWVVIPILLLAVGIYRAVLRRGGIAVIAGALAGTVGVELLLWRADHWTNDRYSLVAWPFLCILLALGVEGLASLGERWQRRGLLRWFGWSAALLLLLIHLSLQVAGLQRYYQLARPDWQLATRATQALARPGGQVYAANEWSRVCLRYYADKLAQNGTGFGVQAADPSTLAQARDETCTFLVSGGYPSSQSFVRSLAPTRSLLAHRGGLGFQIHGLTVPGPEQDCVWVLPESITGKDDAGLVINFEESNKNRLLWGWSTFERNPAGQTYVWSTGREAALALGGMQPMQRRLVLSLWPFPAPGQTQSVELWLNGQMLAQQELAEGQHNMEVEVPASAWQADENVLRMHFAYAVSPSSLGQGTDDRILAVAFDRLQLLAANEINQ